MNRDFPLAPTFFGSQEKQEARRARREERREERMTRRNVCRKGKCGGKAKGFVGY